MQTETPNVEPERFETAVETGEVVDRSGYHQPDGRRHSWRCGCSRTTDKGAYRDVTVKMPDGRLIHYYHQSPVVVENGAYRRLDSHGYKSDPDTKDAGSSTTKQRISAHLPRGVGLRRRDYVWQLTRRDADPVEFRDGMVIDGDGQPVDQ